MKPLDFFYLYLKAFFKPSTAPSTAPLASSTTSFALANCLFYSAFCFSLAIPQQPYQILL